MNDADTAMMYLGGFFIHRHLCQATGRNFMLYCMGVEQLTDDRFGNCLKPLTDNDLNRLAGLEQAEIYKEVAAYMREQCVKLE